MGAVRQASAERHLMRSANKTQVIAQAVGVGMVFVVADRITGKPETAGDTESHECRGVTAIHLDAHIARREIRVANAPDIHEICRDTKRVDGVGADQIRIAQGNRLGLAVVTNTAGRQ